MQSARKKGGREREEPNYEREFMESECLFRAREIILPQGLVAKTLRNP